MKPDAPVFYYQRDRVDGGDSPRIYNGASVLVAFDVKFNRASRFPIFPEENATALRYWICHHRAIPRSCVGVNVQGGRVARKYVWAFSGHDVLAAGNSSGVDRPESAKSGNSRAVGTP